MDQLACVDVPGLPLQLLLREHPEWQGLPVVVVDADKPQGLVLWANEPARRAGVAPGSRYGSSLSLAPELRAGVVAQATIARGVDELMERLRDFSAGIESSKQEPGVFWLDAHGLDPLFGSAALWAGRVRTMLAESGFRAGVVVGYGRFASYAIARASAGGKWLVFDTPEAEEEVVGRVPLARLGIAPRALAALAKLGIHRVEDFSRLPHHGIKKRFGPELERLHRFATGALELPLAPVAAAPAFTAQLACEYGETNVERLGFMLKPLVDGLLGTLAAQGHALTELGLALGHGEAPMRHETIRTAEPTLSSVAVLELVRLRLGAQPFAAPVLALTLTAQSVKATPDQLRLFGEAPRRDLGAAGRAFARLVAVFGPGCVVHAVARDRHLPEGHFAFEPLAGLAPPQAHPAESQLVRRLFTRATPLPPVSHWLAGWPGYGPVEHHSGPYRLNGGWWRGGLHHRDYRFVQVREGELLWVYCDEHERHWYLQGDVL